MPDEFNPYHVWLAIPPEDLPANHYRLLGVRLFETNADVIDGAADRQMAHLRTFQGGKHGELSQRLLNEVAVARVCLLDAKKRAAYDTQLRARLPAVAPAPKATRPAPQFATSPLPSLRRAVATPDDGDKWDDLLGNAAAKPAQTAGGKSTNSLKAAAARRAANARMKTIGIAIGVVLIAAGGFGVYRLNSNSDGTLVFNSSDQADATITVDGMPIDVPGSRSWEHNFLHGKHHITAERPAFKFDADVDLAAGERLTISPEWKAKATLVLHWPLAERVGAVLKIDGRQRQLPQHEPLELPVDPGQHRVEVLRPGVPPFVANRNIAEDQREMVIITRPLNESKLVLDWPAAQRTGAELTIDGKTAVDSSAQPLELTLDPGRHVVRISRPGFEAFRQTIEVSQGARALLKPTWTIHEKATPTVVEIPVPKVAAPEPEKKLAIPPAAEQERVAKQLDEIYKISRSSSGARDPAKARELYEVAAKAGAAPVERYMLLMKGAEIAAAGGDLDLALQGIENLAADFEIAALEIKQKLLEKFVTLGKGDQVNVAIPVAEQLMDEAVAADRYDVAIMLAATANRAAAKAQLPTRKETEDRLAHRRRDIHLIEPIYAAAKKARETLDKNPADTDANLAVGRWRCLYKNDWANGLPLLAKGSGEKFKAIAEQEIAAPTDVEQQIQLADAWWNLAQKEAGTPRDSLRLHAGIIYQAAMPNLTSALKRAEIGKRLTEIANLPQPAIAAAQKKSSSPKTPSAASQFPLGRRVDVLRLVDLARDGVSGKWTWKGTDLNCDSGEGNRIEFPVVVDGGYDLEVEFTRTKGESDVVAMLSVGSHACMITLSGYGGASGLMNLDGHDANDGRNPTSVRPGQLENDHRYQLSIGVRILAEDRATVDVSLDGKPYLPHWEGNPAALSENWFWEMPNQKRLGLGATRSDVAFHSARLRMVSGAALPAAIESPAPPTVSSDQPPDNSSVPVAFPRNTWVDVLRLVDTARDRVNGLWSWNGNELSCKSAPFSRIGFPVVVDGGYDLEVEFTRTAGYGDVATVLSIGSHRCAATLSAWGGAVSALTDVGGHSVNDPANPFSVRPGKLENGRRYRMLVSVRILAEDRASIDVSLDDKPYLPHWEGSPDALSLQNGWSLPNPKWLGLASYDSKATFHSARLRMVSGHATVAEVPAK
jgi:hypothetical protein